MKILKVERISKRTIQSIKAPDGVMYSPATIYKYNVGNEEISIFGSVLLFHPKDEPNNIQGYYAYFKDLHVPKSILLTALERGEIAEEEFEMIVSKTKPAYK
jgi:hypothetical protein